MKLELWKRFEIPNKIINKYFVFYDIIMQKSINNKLNKTITSIREYHIDLCNWVSNESLINWNGETELKFKDENLNMFNVNGKSLTKFIKVDDNYYYQEKAYKKFRTRGRCIFVFKNRDEIENFVKDRCTFDYTDDTKQFLVLGEGEGEKDTAKNLAETYKTSSENIKKLLDDIYTNNKDFILCLM